MTVETQCACRVVQDYYSDNEEMLAKLAAGASGYDLIVPAGNVVESLIRQKIPHRLQHPQRRRGAGAGFDGAAQERPASRPRTPLH